jgi:prepilin-type N-terminal cleavage/methylation domain-containing protein
MRKSLSASSGFTLVELSIVLVVVGLIIGSVLVGSSILQNSRVTATVNALQSVQSAVSTYNQNYNALPGDDKKASTNFPANGPTNSGGGNGQIGTNNSFATAVPASNDGEGESALAWQCLRAAGLVKGAGTDPNPMGNAFGGVVGLQSTAFTSLSGNVVCASAIPSSAAQIIDQRLDDGNAKTGNVRGGTAVNEAAADYVNGGNPYVVCMAL